MITNPDMFLESSPLPGGFVSRPLGGQTEFRVGRYNASTRRKRAGVAINPATPAACWRTLQEVDQVLVMTVDPGFGHQLFLPTTLAKIRRVRKMIDRTRRRASWKWRGY